MSSISTLTRYRIEWFQRMVDDARKEYELAKIMPLYFCVIEARKVVDGIGADLAYLRGKSGRNDEEAKADDEALMTAAANSVKSLYNLVAYYTTYPPSWPW